jgi:hypothetical protein
VVPPSPAALVGQVAEVRVQQGNVEPKDSLPKSGMAWSSAAFLVAVSAIAMLLGMVIYLFTRWRNTEQKTVAVPTATDLVRTRTWKVERERYRRRPQSGKYAKWLCR